MKKEKAAGIDEIQNKVWIWRGRGVKRTNSKLCRRVWRREGMPERWRKEVIVPIAKKKGAREIGEHKGITLLLTAYKIYASVVANRLIEEAEKKRILPEWQAGFRKERGTIDNVYVLNYVVGRELEKEKKMIQVFRQRKV